MITGNLSRGRTLTSLTVCTDMPASSQRSPKSRASVWDRLGGIVATGCVALALSGCLPGPRMTVTTVVTGLDHPWDVGFAGGTMVYTERAGRIGAVVNGQKRLLAAPSDIVHKTEAGMLGLAVDPAFASNRYIYTCMASTRGGPSGDVRVVRWRLDAALTTLTDRADIVTVMPLRATG